MENDLIRKSRVQEILDHAQIGAHDVDEFFSWASDIVAEEPAISPESLRERGRWIMRGGKRYCSCCKQRACVTRDSEDFWYTVGTDYCPSCGARMDLEG